MKIAISSSDGAPESSFQERFGRCKYFAIFDDQKLAWNKISNPARQSRGGAGTQVVQHLAEHGVEVVISGRYGPNAFSALNTAGMRCFLADQGSPQELVTAFQNDQLRQAEGPTGPGMHRS